MAKRKKKSRSRAAIQLQTAPRNSVAQHPLMRKGGVHEKSKSAQRSAARRETQRLARDWGAHFPLLISYC